MRALRWSAPLLVALVLASAWAQTLDASLSLSGSARASADLALLGLREGDQTADVRLGVAVTDTGTDALLAARWSRSATLGLLGAVTIELDGAVRTDGHRRLRVGGRGVLGPASVALDVSARTAGPERFSVVGVAPRADGPRLPGTVVSLAAGVRYRIDRQLLLGLEPAIFGSAAGIGARLDGTLRLRRWWGDVDALAAWHGWYDPVTSGVTAGIGAGVVWAPRRAPEWRAVAWLGIAEGAVLPGLEVAGRADVASGIGIDVAIAAQPFRRDVPPYRAFLEVSVDAVGSELYGRVQAQAYDATPVAAALGLGARVPLGGR